MIIQIDNHNKVNFELSDGSYIPICYSGDSISRDIQNLDFIISSFYGSLTSSALLNNLSILENNLINFDINRVYKIVDNTDVSINYLVKNCFLKILDIQFEKLTYISKPKELGITLFVNVL